MPEPGAGSRPVTRSAASPASDPGRYPNLGTEGLQVSSDPGAEVSVITSAREGWLVAIGLLLAGCLAMGIYLVVLHH
ncbi:MAG: hypothetical protein ACRENX_02960 [Candidatus Dormibacteria bacterium]